ncbi:NAD(P)-dependent oxidoreductase [Dactylosporangium cerinum]
MVGAMLKIVVFGAGGKAGGAAVVEARARGHEVTPLVRSAADVTDPAAVAAGAAGHDVAIAAVADATADPAVFFRAAAESLVAGLKDAGVNRLVWVGIASLLPNASGVPVMDTAGFPPEFQPFSLAHRAALDIIRRSDLEWVAVSPSGNFDLEGEPAGAYRLALGDLAEHITYADHARALIDEAERAQFRQTHVGVAN